MLAEMSRSLRRQMSARIPRDSRLYELDHPEDGIAVLAITKCALDAWGMRRAEGILFYQHGAVIRSDLWFLGPEWATERELILAAITPDGWSIKQEAIAK